jgi:hypothetical protein
MVKVAKALSDILRGAVIVTNEGRRVKDLCPQVNRRDDIVRPVNDGGAGEAEDLTAPEALPEPDEGDIDLLVRHMLAGALGPEFKRLHDSSSGR